MMNINSGEMKIYLISILLIISVINSFGQKVGIQESDCRFNPSIHFEKERLKLNDKQKSEIKNWGKAVKRYIDSKQQNYQITLWVFGDENSNKGILRAKILANFLVKYEGIERKKINIIELSNKDDTGGEKVSFGFDLVK